MVERVDTLMLYCEVVEGGEDRAERRVRHSIPTADLPAVHRALGVYLSEREAAEVVAEVEYRQGAGSGGVGEEEGEGWEGDEGGGDEGVRASQAGVRGGAGALRMGVRRHRRRGEERGKGGEGGEETREAGGAEVDTEALVRLLMQEGEKMTAAEIANCLDDLIGPGESLMAGGMEEEEKEAVVGGGGEDWELLRLLQRLPRRMTPEVFASTLLGFQDY